jgi:hypothetical protein
MEEELKKHSGTERRAKSYLKRGDDDERLEYAGAEPRRESPLRGDLPGRRVLERGLQHGVGAEPERVLEREVGGEGREPLPERGHALSAGDGGAAVRDAAVCPRAVELQPRLDHVDGLQAARLNDATEGPCRRLHGRRDRRPASSAARVLGGR